ncbi:MAG: flagellar basal body-associated FliL family protein [Rhodobacteraceae bacterium]|nr:flagellar basal body-associated FliL family protein [Paracoccaceae bacterium]
MTDTAVPDPAPRGGFLKKALIGVVAIAVLGGGGFAAGLYFAQQQAAPADDILSLIEDEDSAMGDGPRRVPKVVPDETLFETSYYEFPDLLTTNLRNGSRFLQIGIGVSTQYDETVVANVERHALALKSDMLAVMSGFTEEEVTGQAGRMTLAVALKTAMNARLEELEGFGGVEAVFFPSFVMQ